MERLVRTQTESDLIKEHSPTGDDKGRVISGYGIKSIGRGALTTWGGQMGGHVKTQKESDREGALTD